MLPMGPTLTGRTRSPIAIALDALLHASDPRGELRRLLRDAQGRDRLVVPGRQLAPDERVVAGARRQHLAHVELVEAHLQGDPRAAAQCLDAIGLVRQTVRWRDSKPRVIGSPSSGFS